jgi:branched-chain amino acid transport system permease protein
MEYFIHLAILLSLFSILALSLNLVIGFTGLLSITHAAFYGLGAYAVAVCSTAFGLSFWSGLLLGMIIAGTIALIMGAVLARFENDYYALATFGFNVILFSIFLNWSDATRGPLGIPGIARPSVFGFELASNLHFLILSSVISLLVLALCYYITHSPFGRALQSLREDEVALQVFGYNTYQYKMIVFCIAAILAAVAGGLYASYISFIDPSSFGLPESIVMLSMIIVGGIASNRGSIVGVVCILLLPELLRFVGMPDDIAGQMRQCIYGLLLIVLMMYRPQGFFGKYKL